MSINKAGLELIKSFEGCRLQGYKCPAGVWTIGYGYTGKVNGQAITSSTVITAAQAEEYLKSSIQWAETTVRNYTKVSLNENQLAALTSFTYNCGGGAYRTSTLLAKLNAGDYRGAADQLDLWVNGGGKKLPGLVRRRAAEKELFLTPVDSPKPDDDKAEVIINGKTYRVGRILKNGYNYFKLRDLAEPLSLEISSRGDTAIISTKEGN